MLEKEFVVTSTNGLSSRSSVALVNEANKHVSDSFLCYQGEKADMKSIMNVMALVIRNNEKFIIRVEGEDEEKTLEGFIRVLIYNKVIDE